MANLFSVTIDDVDKTPLVLPGTRLNLKSNAWNQLSISFKDFHIAYNSMSYAVKITNNRSGKPLFKGISRNSEISFPAKSYHEAPINCSDFVSVYFTYGQYSYDYSLGDHTEKQVLQDTIGLISPNPIGAYVINGLPVVSKFASTSWDRMLSDLATTNNRLWYWDGDNQLHYFASTGEPAAFGLSDAPNNVTTFPYARLAIRKDMATDNSVTLGGSLVCWKDGLWPGTAIQITNNHLGISAQTVIINEVEVELIKGDVGFQYTIHFGQVKSPRITDYIERSNKSASIDDLGLVPKYINDTTKFLRSDGVYAAASGSVPKLDDCLAPDDNTDLNALTTKHGLLPKLGGGTTNFLRADGTWANPPGGDISAHAILTTGVHGAGVYALVNTGNSSGTVYAQTDYGQGSNAGSSLTYSRGDHRHGTPASEVGAHAILTTGVHGAGVYALVNTGNSSGTVYAQTNYGQGSNAGSSLTYSRGDHRHGTPAAGGGSHTSVFHTSEIDISRSFGAYYYPHYTANELIIVTVHVQANLTYSDYVEAKVYWNGAFYTVNKWFILYGKNDHTLTYAVPADCAYHHVISYYSRCTLTRWTESTITY